MDVKIYYFTKTCVNFLFSKRYTTNIDALLFPLAIKLLLPSIMRGSENSGVEQCLVCYQN